LLKHTVLALPKSELALQGYLAAYTIYKFESIKRQMRGLVSRCLADFLKYFKKSDNRGLGEGVSLEAITQKISSTKANAHIN
jgi:hypothetical protein